MAWISTSDVANAITHAMLLPSSEHRASADAALRSMRRDAINLGDCCVELLSTPAVTMAISDVQLLDHLLTADPTPSAAAPERALSATATVEFDFFSDVDPAGVDGLRQSLAHELNMALAAALLLQGLVNDGMWSEGSAFSDKPMVLQRMHQLAFGFPLSVFTGAQHARWATAVGACGVPRIVDAWTALSTGRTTALSLPSLDCPELAAPVAVRAARTRTRVVRDLCPLPVAAAAAASVNQVDRIIGIALDALAAMCVCEYPNEAWDGLLVQAVATADAELSTSTIPPSSIGTSMLSDNMMVAGARGGSRSYIVAPMQRSLRALSWAHRCAVKLATSSASHSAVSAPGTNSIARNAALPRNFAVTAPLRLSLLRYTAHVLKLLETRREAVLTQVRQNFTSGGSRVVVVDDGWYVTAVAWATAAAIITSTTLTCSLGRRALAALTDEQRHAEQLRSEIAAVATQFLAAALRALAPQLHQNADLSDVVAASTLWAPQLVLLLGRRTYGAMLQSALAVVARTTVFSHAVGAVCESLLTQLQHAATPLRVLLHSVAADMEAVERRLTTAMHAGVILDTVHSVLETAADEFFAQIPAAAVIGLLVRVYCAAPGNDDLSFMLLQPGGSGNGEDTVAVSAADTLDQLAAEPLPPPLVSLIASAVTTSVASGSSPTAAFTAGAAASGFHHNDQQLVACLAARVQNKFVGGLCPTDDATVMHARLEGMSNDHGLMFGDLVGLAQSALAADMADSDATTAFSSSGDASSGGAGFAGSSGGAAIWDAVGVSENLSAVVELVAENDAAGTAAALVAHVLAMYSGNSGGGNPELEVSPYVRAHGATSIVLSAAKTFTTTGAAFDRLVDSATSAQMVRGFLALVNDFFLHNAVCVAAAASEEEAGSRVGSSRPLTVPSTAHGRPAAAPWTQVLLFSHIAARALVAACALASSYDLLSLVVATCSDVCGFLRRCAYVTVPLLNSSSGTSSSSSCGDAPGGAVAAAFRLVAAAAASSLARAMTRSPATRAALEVPLLQEGLYGVLLRATLGGGECGDVGAAELTAALFERASPAADRWLWAVPVAGEQAGGSADAREAWTVLAHLCQDLIAASAGDRMRATAAPALGRLLRAVVELHELPASGADAEAHEAQAHADPAAVPRRCTVLRTLLDPLVTFVGALPSLDGAPAARVLCERLRQLLVVGTADCNCGLHYAAAFGALTRVALADALATPTDATVRFAATCVAAGSMRVFEARLQLAGSAEAQAQRAQATLMHLGHIASWVGPMCALAEAPALWSGAVTSTTTSMACTAFGTLALRGCFSVVADPNSPDYGAPLADGSESALEPYARRWLTAVIAGMVRLIKFTARDVDYQGVFTAIAIIAWYVPSVRVMLLPSYAANLAHHHQQPPYSANDLALLWGLWLSLFAAPSCELRLKCFTTIALAVMYQPAAEEHMLTEAAGGGAVGAGAVSIPVVANVAEAHLTLRGAAAQTHHTIARTLAVAACAATGGAATGASATEVDAATKLPPNTGAIVGRTLLQAVGETWRYVACVLQAAPHLTPPPCHHHGAAVTSPQAGGYGTSGGGGGAVRFSIASVASLNSSSTGMGGGGGRGADHASPYVPRHSFALPSPGAWHDADMSGAAAQHHGAAAGPRMSVASDVSLIHGHSGVHSPSVHLPRPSVSGILAGTINSGASALGAGAPPRSALARKPTYFVEAPYAPLEVGFDQASVTAAGHFLNSCLAA